MKRDIYEVANQLGGYVGPDTPEPLKRFLLKEEKAAAALADEITRLRSELANARNAALEEAAKEIEHLSPTTHVPERLSPVTDDYGEIVGHFVSPAGVRKRYITGERAAKAIRALKAEDPK
jgi:hypothetical protein